MAIRNRPQGAALLVVGDFNINLAVPEGRERNEGVALALVKEGLEDMSGHFLTWHKLWLKNGRTWATHRGGREVCPQTEYILGTHSCLFHHLVVWDARHNTDHYLVLGCLCRAAPAAHLRYLGKRTCFPIRPPATPYKADRIFAELRRAIPRPPWREYHCQA